MWTSKEIAVIIVLAALSFVSTILIVQTAGMITGIPGANFIFTIILAIQTSFALLYYQGKRWRFFAQMALFYLLVIPTYLGGTPFDALGKTHFLITAFLTDVVVNSLYSYFNKQKRLLLFSCFAGLFYWVLQPFIGVGVASVLFMPDYATRLLSVVTLLSPVIIAEALAGGYIGYKIYQRIVKTNYSQDKFPIQR